MIENLPMYIPVGFAAITLLTVFLLYKATGLSTKTLVWIGVWLIAQLLLGCFGFYQNTEAVPPRFPLLITPPLVLIAALFLTPRARAWIDGLNAERLTYLHAVRVPVEVVLFLLYQNGLIPQLMTFEGRNFDIVAGLTAPFIAYLGYRKKTLNNKVILGWNVIGLGLLLNIVINAVLSVPTPFQKFGFEQPNVAVLYFPYVWLPCCVVPAVLFAHVVSIRQAWVGKTAPPAPAG